MSKNILIENDCKDFFLPQSQSNITLTELAPKTKIWSDLKCLGEQIANNLESVDEHKAKKLRECCRSLEAGERADPITGAIELYPFTRWSCGLRICPICQWRKTLRWRSKLFNALPKLTIKYPNARFIHLTLTVKDCVLSDLKSEIATLNQAYARLLRAKDLAGVMGWVKAISIRLKSNRAQPHLHVLLMVPYSYATHYYISDDTWRVLWMKTLKANYLPEVEARFLDGFEGVKDTIRYIFDIKDFVESANNHHALIAVSEQIADLRLISTGGIFRGIKGSAQKIIPENCDKIVSFFWGDSSKDYLLDT
jgi:plasmid rolling circle replication initiator protein Rep